MKTSLDEQVAFIAVVDTGSITAAANQLGQTVSAVSRSLARLEQKLESTLLTRTTRRIELTEEGKLFLSHARNIVASVEMAEDVIALRRQQPAGQLRINAATPFMLHVIVPLIPGFSAQYPEIKLELNTNDEIIDLLEHRTDIAIRIGTLQDSTLHATPLGSTRSRILASPAYLANSPSINSVQDLSRHRLLGFSQPDSLNLWPLQDHLGNPLHIKPDVAASSGETLRQLALNGEGLVRLSDFMSHDDIQRGDLVQVLAADTLEVRMPINAVYYRNTQLSSRVVSFLDYLKQHMQAWD